VWHRVALCVVLWSCGFNSRPADNAGDADAGSGGVVDGAPPPDAPGTDAGSGSGSGSAMDCLAHWRDGTVAITGQADELTSLKTTGLERDPWVSSDGKRMYFARNPGSSGDSDVYFATRSSVEQPFGNAANVTNLNSNDSDDRAALTPDELVLVMAHKDAGKARILITMRATMSEPFGHADERHLASVNLDSADHYDPFLSDDGLRLYLAPNSGQGGRQEIKVAVRTAIDGDFIVPVDVVGINSSNTNNSDPALSHDELVLVFSSDRGSGSDGDLYYASRPTRTAAFGTPKLIPTVNTGSEEGDPVLSADGCDLYFSSKRDGNRFHLFHAKIAK